MGLRRCLTKCDQNVPTRLWGFIMQVKFPVWNRVLLYRFDVFERRQAIWCSTSWHTQTIETRIPNQVNMSVGMSKHAGYVWNRSFTTKKILMIPWIPWIWAYPAAYFQTKQANPNPPGFSFPSGWNFADFHANHAQVGCIKHRRAQKLSTANF